MGSANSIGIALGVVGAINAVIALVYYARISKVIWMDELKSVNEDKIFQFENPLKVVGIFTVLITFVSGIFPGILVILEKYHRYFLAIKICQKNFLSYIKEKYDSEFIYFDTFMEEALYSQLGFLILI